MKFEKSRLEPLKIWLGGVEYPVRMNFRGMAELEEIYGMSFMKVYSKLTGEETSISDIKTVLHVLLKGGGVEVLLEDLEDLEFSFDMLDIIGDALSRAHRVVSQIQDHKPPQDGKKKTKKTA